MFLECVTTCVNHDDTLAAIEPFARPHFDRWIIVTTPEDELTRDFCRRRGLECVVTRDFHRNGAEFDKARGVDRGMQLLTHQDWALHLDCDIVLPRTFRESLEDAHLDPEKLYGWDRFDIVGREQWERFRDSGFFDKHSRSAHHNVCFPAGLPVGARWADTVQGWCPIGHGQLANQQSTVWRGIRHRRYPTVGHSDASRTDVQYSLLWDRRDRILLPEIVVGHIITEPCAVGANWKGRKTKRLDA